MFMGDLSYRREQFHLQMKRWPWGCPFVALLVQLGPWPTCNWSYCSQKWNIKRRPLSQLQRNTKKRRRICISSIVAAIGLDMFPLLGLFCKPKFEPEEFLRINVLSIAVAHPSHICFWITKITLRYEPYTGQCDTYTERVSRLSDEISQCPRGK